MKSVNASTANVTCYLVMGLAGDGLRRIDLGIRIGSFPKKLRNSKNSLKTSET